MRVGLLQANYSGEITETKKQRYFAFKEIKEQCLVYLSGMVDWHVTLICCLFFRVIKSVSKCLTL